MIVSVPLTLPGLINSINTNIHVGVGARLFDLAYLLGVSHSPIPKPELALMSIPPDIIRYTVHPGISRLLHTVEAFPRPRNDARSCNPGAGDAPRQREPFRQR